MQIRGSHTVHATFTVSEYDVSKEMTATFEKNVVPADVMAGSYPNREGCWEHWEDGHGSGYTTTQRKATEAEVALYQQFRTWSELTQTLMALPVVTSRK
jgi:hypothetical protein